MNSSTKTEIKPLPKETMVNMYRKMLEIRQFEEWVSKLFAEGEIPGLVHLCIGEEAVAVGACTVLRKDDYILSGHRGHGHCIAKGCELKPMMAELLGRATGYCKGRGGSMHISNMKVGVICTTGIAGAGIPISVGVGLSIQMRGTDQVCACFFGDGASNTGAFHEGINMAAVWNLPVVFLCENNRYAISVPITKSTLNENIAERATGYGIPGKIVDGQDALEVYYAVKEAVEQARKGSGPTLLEFKTYRYMGHYEGDVKRGGRYRKDEEVKQWELRDPLKIHGERLLKWKIMTEKEIAELEAQVTKEAEDYVQYAKESPLPDPATVLEDIY